MELKAPFPSKSWFPGSTTSDVEVKERIILLRNYFQEAVSSPDLLTFTKFCLEITSRDKGLSNILEGIGKNLKYQREFPNLYRFYRSSQKYHLAQTFFREFRGLAYPEQMKFLVNKNCSARTFGGEEEIKEATSNWTYFHLKDASSLLGYDFVLSTFESLDTALYYIKKEDIGLLQRPKHHIYRATHVKNKPEIERLLYIEIQRNRLSDDETFIYMNEQFNTPQIHVEGNWPLIKIYEGKSLRLSTKELGEFLIGPVEITITSHSDICFFLTVACLMKKLRPLHLNTPFKTSVSDGFSSHDISI